MKRLLPLALFLWPSLLAFAQQPNSFHSLEITVRTPTERHSVTLTWNPADCQDANGHTIPCPATPAYAFIGVQQMEVGKRASMGSATDIAAESPIPIRAH